MPATLDQGTFSFRPATYTVTQTKDIWTVRDAYFLVTSVVARIETLFNGAPTIKLGKSGSLEALLAAADLTIGTAGVYKSSLSNVLLAPGTTVILTYTAHASTTQGLARIAITGHRVAV